MEGTNKTTEQEFKIPIEELFSKFEDHLKIKNNSRISFSGKFGIGKTYFLNEFFKDNKENYEIFHLFPVNYQISSNENIVEFLKYDILVELLKKNKNAIQENDYGNLVDFQRLLSIWGKNNFVEIFKTGVSLIPKLGRPLKDVIGLTENFWKFKKKIEAGEKGFIDKFLKEIKEKNISETDNLSELLRQKIEEQKTGKQSVLILDDLERIDPEHIFRILNVFSAHLDLDNKETPNKFNFDKIILVADIQNLKSIFHYRYGEQTDFNGYFDKFFSTEVYQFKNEKAVAKKMDKIILHFQREKNEDLNITLGPSGYLKIFLEAIFLESSKLDGKEKLNLRQLLKGVKYPIPILKNTNYTKNSRDAVIPQLINIGIKFLISIFGGMKIDFVVILKKIKNNIKNKETTTRAYEVFSYHLLKIISPFKETGGKFHRAWGEYSIEVENQTIKSARAPGANISNLFFDLLIEYVSNEHYEKQIELF